MRKKLIAIISVLAVSVSLAACGESANTVPDAIEETVEETVENIVEEPQEEAIDETEEVIEEPNEVAEEVIEQSTTEEVEDKEVVAVEAEPAEVAYTYSDTSATMYAKSTVNVRDLPDKIGNKVGSLSQNQEVTVTGKCNETGWYRIDYNGSVAYVSNSFLVNEKVEVAPPAETNTPVNNNPPANSGMGSGTYSNQWGQTWTMTYNDVAAAFGQPVCSAIADSDTTGHFYYIKCHIRDCDYSGPNWLEAIAMVNSQGWSVPSANEANKVAFYDNGLWDVVYVECYR